MPQDWYLVKDENSILDETGESGAFAVAFVNENHKKIVIAYRGSDGPEDIEASGTLWVDGQPLAALGVPLVTPKGEQPIAQMAELQKRSEERSGGKGWASTGRCRGGPDN